MPTHARHSDSIITSGAAEKTAMEPRHVQAHPHGCYPAGSEQETILLMVWSCAHTVKTSGGDKRSISRSQIAPDIEQVTATVSVYARCMQGAMECSSV